MHAHKCSHKQFNLIYRRVRILTYIYKHTWALTHPGLSRDFSERSTAHAASQPDTRCIDTRSFTFHDIQTQVLSTSYVCTYIHMKNVRTYVHTWALTLTHNTHTISRYWHSSSLSHTDTVGTSWGTPSPERGEGSSLYTTYSNTQPTTEHTTTEQHTAEQYTAEQYTTHCQQVLCKLVRNLKFAIYTCTACGSVDWRKESPYHHIKNHIYVIWR